MILLRIEGEYWFVSNFDHALKILPTCMQPSGLVSLDLVYLLLSQAV